MGSKPDARPQFPGVREDADFDSPVRGAAASDVDALVVNLDGYEGPLDVLLDLARAQRVDLRKLPLLALVDQYLAFVEAAKARNLELAADYLVMAAWLAFLKSRLLIPTGDGEMGAGADEMAAMLAFRLQRLDAMRKSAEALLRLPQLGINVFPRGMPEGVRIKHKAEWQADLYELLKAYARQRLAKIAVEAYAIEPAKVYSIEEARARIERLLGAIPDWVDFRSLAPDSEIDAPKSSVVASAFNAALEFAKIGRLDMRQLEAFGPVYVRSRDAAPERTPQ
jgi:segregation and condensation protein A